MEKTTKRKQWKQIINIWYMLNIHIQTHTQHTHTHTHIYIYIYIQLLYRHTHTYTMSETYKLDSSWSEIISWSKLRDIFV